ncbi:MAG TPA: hypothetical protein PKV66_01420, partial [Candidatus Pelethenecus sp.]|nr:hypothetical protein [Candidatus Pelethenecus sp.]
EEEKTKRPVGRPRLNDEEEEKPKRPVGRPRLSDEERKERLKESNRKYYEKMRLLIEKAKSI